MYADALKIIDFYYAVPFYIFQSNAGLVLINTSPIPFAPSGDQHENMLWHGTLIITTISGHHTTADQVLVLIEFYFRHKFDYTELLNACGNI